MKIALVHALRDSVDPACGAMARVWPEATFMNLLDDSLSMDLAKQGGLTQAIVERLLALGRYAKKTGAEGILFTCSAFGQAIEAVRADLDIPVLKPNESAFCAALESGSRISLLVTFEGSLEPLKRELVEAAGNRPIELSVSIVPNALEALQRGDAKAHDNAIADAAAHLPPSDVFILGQFSMARSREAVVPRVKGIVLTTPDAAVADLRQRVIDRVANRRFGERANVEALLIRTGAVAAPG